MMNAKRCLMLLLAVSLMLAPLLALAEEGRGAGTEPKKVTIRIFFSIFGGMSYRLSFIRLIRLFHYPLPII